MANGRPFLLDVTRLIWRRWVDRLPTGIDRVCLAYLGHYGPRSQAVIQRRGFRRILSEEASDRLFTLLSRRCSNFQAKLVRFLAGEALGYPNGLPGKGRVYFNVGHTALDDRRYLDWTRSADLRCIYMIHDLIPITHPEYCRAGEAIRHAGRVRNILASASGIIGNSADTLRALAIFAHKHDLPLPATIAAPLGTALPRSAPTLPGVSPRPMFVMLGTIEGRKNHVLILQLWSRLVASLGERAPQLIVIGQRGWESEQAINLLDRNEALRGAVVEVGRCNDEQLQEYLSQARALLFPSLVEGYGLPLVEALASGTPVIASDIAVFHEVGQGVPDFIDPLDGPAWQSAILAYSDPHSSARAAQLDRMATYKLTTWRDHFTGVDAWLAELGRGGATSRHAIFSTSSATADSLANPPRTRQRSTSTRRNAE